MTIYEQFIDAFKNSKGEVFSHNEIRNILKSKYGTNPISVLPSDYCYNRINNGIKFNKHLFEHLENGYKFLGEKYEYTGKIFHKPLNSKVEEAVGEWKNGKKILYANHQNGKVKSFGINDDCKQISNIQLLRDPFNSTTQIRNLIMRADDYEETLTIIKGLKDVQKKRVPFFLTIEDFDKILKWKLRGQFDRTKRIRESNTNHNIEIITKAAFGICHSIECHETALRINLLKTLNGVEIPVASAILALCYPEKYAVIDFRVWRIIYGEKKKYQSYSIKQYLDYLSVIKAIAQKYDFTPQEMDMAIWQLDIESKS